MQKTSEMTREERQATLEQARRLRGMHADQGAMCPKCWHCHVPSGKQLDKLFDEGEVDFVCQGCEKVFTWDQETTPQQRDEVAGVKIFVVDFTGVERPAQRCENRLEWLGGSVGSGVPVIVEVPEPTKDRPRACINRYVERLVEALKWRLPERPLYHFVTVRQA